MPLDGFEQKVWESCVEDIAGPEYVSGVIPVDSPIQGAADFWGAVEDAYDNGKISEDVYSHAMDFFGEVMQMARPDATIAELGYIEDFDGLKLQMKLPKTDYGRN